MWFSTHKLVWKGVWPCVLATAVGLSFVSSAVGAHLLEVHGFAIANASYSFLDCQGQPRTRAETGGGISLPAEAKANTPDITCGDFFGTAIAIQTEGGLSALQARFAKY